MARLQNTTPTQAQPLTPPPLVGQLASVGEPIPLASWNEYNFAIPQSRIRSWIVKARINGIMREGAVLRFGQRYYVNPAQLNAWMARHSDRTPLSRSTQRKPAQKAAGTRATDGQESTAPQLAPTEKKQKQGRHQLLESQVRQIRNQVARATSPADQEAIITRLAKRYGFIEKSVRDAALGNTYKHLPMPQAKQAETAAA
jgi:hypothetical protein